MLERISYAPRNPTEKKPGNTSSKTFSKGAVKFQAEKPRDQVHSAAHSVSFSAKQFPELRVIGLQEKYRRFTLEARLPRYSKLENSAKWDRLSRGADLSKSNPRYVRRFRHRMPQPESRTELTAEYQQLADLAVRGEISELGVLRMRSVEAKLDELDAAEERHLDALSEYSKDIKKLDELIELGERLRRLL